MPVEQVGENAAEQHADAASTRRDEAEHAHRFGPLSRLDEQRDDQRQRHRRCDRAAESLHRAGDDQHSLRRGEPADQRGGGEQSDPGDEQPPLSEQVSESAAEQQEPTEREQVGVDHPGQRGLGEAEVVLDRGQRDPDDR